MTATRRERVAFDLDETLGTPLFDATGQMAGFQDRPGCGDLLESLKPCFELWLWTVASRRYAEKALGCGLARFFERVVTWDDIASDYKDIRQIGVDWLVDDSEHHRRAAEAHGLANRYILVPAVGSPEDNRNPLVWVDIVTSALLTARGMG